MPKRLIKIVKCEALWWYKDQIGFVYPVEYEDSLAYWVKEETNPSFLRWIYKSDTKPWEDEFEKEEINETNA